MFALYGLLNRYVARKDDAATSFFWTGTVGAVVLDRDRGMVLGGDERPRLVLMAMLCVTGALGHFTLIKTYEVAEAGAVQPFAYLQLVFASALGLFVFGETLRLNVVIGAHDHRRRGPLHLLAGAQGTRRLTGARTSAARWRSARPPRALFPDG